MSSFNTIRHLRRFSTVDVVTVVCETTTTVATEVLTTVVAEAVTTSSNASPPATISISKAKAKLKTEHDPDRCLEIYSSFSTHFTSPVSSRYAQELTIKRLAKASRFEDIESLIESQKSDPKITQEPFLSALIRSYGRAGMFDHALKMYNQMDELGTPRTCLSFNALLAACNKSNLYEKVPELFDEMPQRYGFLPNMISYGILVKSYCGLDNPEKALDVLKDMEKKGVEITAITYTSILDGLYKKGMGDEGNKLWDRMIKQGCLPDNAAFNVRLMYAREGKPEAVNSLLDEMVHLGLKPDTISYNYLMTCYFKNGMMDEAKKVYDGLKGNGCKPNAATFKTLIYHLCQNGSFETGYDVFKESVKVDRIPDFGTLKHLVEGLVKNKKTRDAKGLIRTGKKKFPPSFMNAWNKLEIELGLVSNAADSADVAGDK